MNKKYFSGSVTVCGAAGKFVGSTEWEDYDERFSRDGGSYYQPTQAKAARPDRKGEKTMFTYRIDNDSRKGELQTVRTRKQLDRAYSAWYTWTDDVRGQAFCSSFFSAWDKEGNCVIADFA